MLCKQGNADLAFDNLQRAIALDPENREMAETDEDFASLRDEPRFRALLQP